MRYIDTLDLRWHIGQPTWEIIDELLEMIDASTSEEEVENRVQDAHNSGYEDGYAEGLGDGCNAGLMAGRRVTDD